MEKDPNIMPIMHLFDPIRVGKCVISLVAEVLHSPNPNHALAPSEHSRGAAIMLDKALKD